MSIIQLKHINKAFQTGRFKVDVLRDVNLEISEGDFISIMGPSGSGKSTLLSLLGLLETYDEGEYYFSGNNTNTLGANQKADIRNEHIGFVFQSFNLIENLSAYENIALPMQISRKNQTGPDIKNRVNELLEQIALTHRQEQYPYQLSGGQQQMVAIARAVANKPKVLLLDEPTGNLDSKNGDAVLQYLEKLNKEGVTICMVTHDYDFAARASKQIKIVDGRLYKID